MEGRGFKEEDALVEVSLASLIAVGVMLWLQCLGYKNSACRRK